MNYFYTITGAQETLYTEDGLDGGGRGQVKQGSNYKVGESLKITAIRLRALSIDGK